jgi:hypothetical protein
VGSGQTRRPASLPVLTMICAYSRWLLALLIPSRRAEDLFAGWWQLVEQLGAVPRALVWDGEGAIGRWRAGRAELTAECQAFRGVLAAKVIICRPAVPEAEGLIERSHDWRQFETTIGALKFPELRSNPQMLLGRSMHENSNMDSTINSSVTENN